MCVVDTAVVPLEARCSGAIGDSGVVQVAVVGQSTYARLDSNERYGGSLGDECTGFGAWDSNDSQWWACDEHCSVE